MAAKSTIRIQRQLAVFLENRPGALARTCQALANAKINILALSILDTVDHAIVRMVVDRPKEAEQVLTGLRVLVQAHDVILMDIEHQAGAISRLAEQLTNAGINIEYAYCTSPSSEQRIGGLVLRTNDLEATINALS